MAWGWVSRCWANLFPFANAEMNMPRQFILSICGTFTGYRCGGRLLKTNIYTSGTVDLEICTWICRITARGARCKNSCLLGVGWCWMNAYIYIYTYTSRYLKHLDTEFTRWIYPGVGRLDNPAESPRKGRRLVDRLMPIFILWVNMGVGFHDLP